VNDDASHANLAFGSVDNAVLGYTSRGKRADVVHLLGICHPCLTGCNAALPISQVLSDLWPGLQDLWGGYGNG
jgi:hypothetical protein